MGRLYGILGVLAFIVLVAFVAYLIRYVVKPRLDQKARMQALRDQRQADLEDVLHQQQTEAARDGWEDMKRHKARLERSLDDLHGTSPEDRTT